MKRRFQDPIPYAAAEYIDELEDENERLRFNYEAAENDVESFREENERLRAIIKANDNYDQDATEHEVEKLRRIEEPARTLYRFVMESWYARTIAVPSGVLERMSAALADQPTEEKS